MPGEAEDWGNYIDTLGPLALADQRIHPKATSDIRDHLTEMYEAAQVGNYPQCAHLARIITRTVRRELQYLEENASHYTKADQDESNRETRRHPLYNTTR
jgi:hypothetical protein